MARYNYKTNQKELIMNIISTFNKDWTIRKLYDALDGKVGLTTIYRFVDKMVLDGTVKKIVGKDNVTYYCYLGSCDQENHFYLKCDNCGKNVHIDCKCMSDLVNHIFDEHGFTTNKEHIILNGICNNCRSKI